MSDTQQTWVVLKFGGTSVSSRARWETIAQVLNERLAEGLRPVVVCSALSGISNMLEELLDAARQQRHEEVLERIEARHREIATALQVDCDDLLGQTFEELRRLALGASLIGEVSPRLRARVMAAGELMSTRLGAAFLNAQGVHTAWYDARNMLDAVREPNTGEHRRFLSAACAYDADVTLQARLEAEPAKVVLTQGFIARGDEGHTVLLGRGGSDTSAAYFAAKMDARRLEIWTDVPGMFTANPRHVPSARLLRQLDYDEAQELATMGAKVLHPRCIDPVRRSGIPLHIRCTQQPDAEGTVISGDVPDFGAQVKAISAKGGVRLISMDTLGMWQQVGFLADMFGVFKARGLSIDLVATSEANVTVSLDPTANALEPAVVDGLIGDLSGLCKARALGPCAAVSLVGHNIRAILHRLAPALEVFDEHQIYLVSQAASDLNLTFVVAEDQADRLVRKLHSLLFRDRPQDELLGPSWREFFDPQHDDHAAHRDFWWQDRRDTLLHLAAAETPIYVYDEATLGASVDAVQSIGPVERVFYAIKANPHPEILRLFEGRALGFECVSPGELDHVRALFPGIDAKRLLFTPNFAPPEEYAHGFEVGANVTLDSLYPLEHWPQVFAGHEVLVRIDPGRGRGHHKYVRTAGPHSKFGVAPGELARLSELARANYVHVVGLHAHVGSGIRDPETWSDTALFLSRRRDLFPEVRAFNLGGGLGVAERPGQKPLDVEALSAALLQFKEAQPDVALWLEPGRFMVAEAGVLLATVTQVKQKGEITYVGINAGMNTLIRPALYGAYHQIVNLTRLGETPAMHADVVGPICESGDVLGHGRRLPHTEAGDVLLVATTGAYGHSMSSNYNLRPPAAETILRSE